MAAINMSSIMGKVDKWAKSPAGKKDMADVIRAYRASGVSTTGGGGFVFTQAMMTDVTNELIAALRRSALHLQIGGLLQPSVVEHFDSLTGTMPQIQPNGDYLVLIEFTDDVHRDSLLKRDGTRTGTGIDNIIEMFEKGVTEDGGAAKGSVFGLWESAGYETWSVRHRPALGFVQSTIDRFNMKYRGTGCEATLLW